MLPEADGTRGEMRELQHPYPIISYDTVEKPRQGCRVA
jgi:hypothetical protein